ncbi:transcription factor BIM2 isoform X1 [Pistacia vera]|uniref:transcription factor BIM2 isoform X1 n=1 Tax=Pistacia vera TaxID=55513 RepID=UPI001262AFBC|nr:transcription factor BIM2 isoform X1 [Pistacia vera]
MRTSKPNQDDEEYDDEDFMSKKETTSNSNNNNIKDGKNSDKASAIRSKHSVTEQRRRSKINERFQILRDLIPHSDQKRDTASFLLEVIEYVQFLQEKLQKYEGTYQDWSSEPTKLMPWRNSHWRVQSFAGQPHAKNGSGPGSMFPGKFDDGIPPTMLTSSQNPLESDPSRDVSCKMDRQQELANKGTPLPMSLQGNMPTAVRNDMLVHPLQRPVSDAQSNECPTTGDIMNQQEELTVEGGTISISSVYSQGLLNTLTQALESAGLDLSQANISVQIDLGKRSNRGLMSGSSIEKGPQNPASSNQAMAKLRDFSSSEDSDQAQKRLKT